MTSPRGTYWLIASGGLCGGADSRIPHLLEDLDYAARQGQNAAADSAHCIRILSSSLNLFNDKLKFKVRRVTVLPIKLPLSSDKNAKF